MPLWSSRSSSAHSPSLSTAALPSTSSSSSASSPPAPPGFLANHHRSLSSYSTTTSSTTTKGKQRAHTGSIGRGGGGGNAARSALDASSFGADDEPWDEGSDDELQEDLTSQLKATKLSVQTSLDGRDPSGASSSSSALSPTTATGGPASASSSSWFNPFSSSSTSSRAPPSRQASTSSTLTLSSSSATASPAAEAVAAALSGRPHSSHPLPPPLLREAASYLAGASKVQEEADKQVRESERRKSLERGDTVEGGKESPEQGEETREKEGEGDAEEGKEKRERRGSGWQKEQWRKAIREDVEELVKDPAHVLARLKVAWAPKPPPAPLSPRRVGRGSISSVVEPSANTNADESFTSPAPPAIGSGDVEAEEDDNPAAGYVQLDAPSLSSADPTLFDYSAPPVDPEEEGEKGREKRRKRKFLEVLGEESVDLAELRKLAWNGVPGELRTMVWQLLLGYLPLPSSRRASVLARKRLEYASLVRQAFSRGVRGLEPQTWHQISIDVPRTRPGVLLWASEATQRSLERILYVWAIRHPASGYVQGINDLVGPFFEVFLEAYLDCDPSAFDLSVLPAFALEALEADSFWCLSKLLDGIQDNYIFAQPGIVRIVGKMEGLCARVDAPLAAHLQAEGVQFIQFAFRWVNCLLMRELSVRNIVRMWDTYLAEGGDAFSEFHLYVCLAFLVRWSERLREMDFQSIIIFLQSLPTQDWTDKDTELLLSEAFLWSRTFQAR